MDFAVSTLREGCLSPLRLSVRLRRATPSITQLEANIRWSTATGTHGMSRLLYWIFPCETAPWTHAGERDGDATQERWHEDLLTFVLGAGRFPEVDVNGTLTGDFGWRGQGWRRKGQVRGLQMLSEVHFLGEGRGWWVKRLRHSFHSDPVFGSVDDGNFSPFSVSPKMHHGCKKRQHRAANRT